MSGRIKVDHATLAVLREMAAAYMSTKDLGGPEIGVLPSVSIAMERDQRWRRAWMEYERQESARTVNVMLPEVDVSALGALIDPGAALERLAKEEIEHGTRTRKRRHLRRSTSRK